MTVCVYTCMIGRYETLNEQPVASQSAIPFICLTDNPALASATWRIVRVEPAFRRDPVRSQRLLKLLPHHHLPDFERSIYIDNSVILSVPPEQILAACFQGGGFAVPTHSYRQRVVDEFTEVMTTLLDDQSRVAEQLAHYEAIDPDGLLERPYWAAILMRDHRDPRVRAMLETWAMHVLRYSRRDQLSLNHVARQAGVIPSRIEIDNFRSWFHAWPHAAGRNERVRRFRPVDRRSADTALARTLERDFARREDDLNAALTQARRELAERSAQVAALASSRSWKVTRPLRALNRVFFAGGEPTLAAPATAAPMHFVTTRGGRRIFVDPGDQRAAALVKSGGDFNPTSLRIWRQLCAERDWTRIVDVGANYGEMIVGTDFPEGADVLALEPNPYVLPYLLRTVRESGQRVEVLAVAASDRNGTFPLYIDRDWSGTSSLAEKNPSDSSRHRIEVREVETVTLATLLSWEAGVRLLLKLDVERYEVPVLRALDEGLAKLDDFAALVEMLHLDDGDIAWILQRFDVSLWHLKDEKLVTAQAESVAALRALLSGGAFYPQDGVLRRRAT